MRAEKPKPEAVSWGGVLGEGQQARSPPARGSGQRAVGSPAASGAEPRPPKGFPLFSAVHSRSPLLTLRGSQKLKNSYPIQTSVNYCSFGDAV